MTLIIENKTTNMCRTLEKRLRKLRFEVIQFYVLSKHFICHNKLNFS